jgi:sugar (pentulose or hexulose) kinase
MIPVPVIVIFDIGKTNKKLFLFDEDCRMVFERSESFAEAADEDGFPCENIEKLTSWIFDSLNEVAKQKEYQVKAVNFSAYGASLVYIGKNGKPLTPLYNYLKPYPAELSAGLYLKYRGVEKFCKETASPALGSLNSGLQLYRLKYEQPDVYKQVKYALHLPQYLSSLLTGEYYSEITSIGCHTGMWNFEANRYHDWIEQEGLISRLAPVVSSEKTIQIGNYKVGIGLHDSSTALIPYLVNFKEPFLLISTGTWSISLNPFNQAPLTANELKQDCLCYIQYQGKPVKAARLFSGHEHDQQVKRVAAHFMQDGSKFSDLPFDPKIVEQLKKEHSQVMPPGEFIKESAFATRDLAAFYNSTEAYHQLMMDLVQLQVMSTQLVLKDSDVKRIFVDGGFSKNSIFMNLLAAAFPEMEVFAASTAQASAVGAALSINNQWNKKPVPADIVRLNRFYKSQDHF